MKNRPKKRDELWFSFGVYGAVGFQLVFSVVVGALLGDWIDKKQGTAPFCLMAGVLLGMAAGFYQLFRITNWKNEKKKR